jgi:hypothetical protein
MRGGSKSETKGKGRVATQLGVERSIYNFKKVKFPLKVKKNREMIVGSGENSRLDVYVTLKKMH